VKAEVPGGSKKLQNEELHRMCCSLNITILRRMRGVEHVKHMGNMRNMYIVLVGKCRYRWYDNIKIDIKEIAKRLWTGFIRLIRETNGSFLMNILLNHQVPYKAGNFMTFKKNSAP